MKEGLTPEEQKFVGLVLTILFVVGMAISAGVLQSRAKCFTTKLLLIFDPFIIAI